MAWLVFALIVVTLVLTLSRAAITSLAVTILAVAWLRYPRLVWIVVFGIAIIFLLPNASQGYGTHFLEGIQGRDLATQMRFGEYKDAFILLERYPLIGVGFAAAPDADIYLGVANAYLTIAEEMGFVGLAVFVLVIGVLFWWAYIHRQDSDHESSLVVTWWGIHAGLASILVVGMFDHYFVNLEFHPAQIMFWLFVGLALSATRLMSALQSN
jgi:O-antigen ligase